VVQAVQAAVVVVVVLLVLVLVLALGGIPAESGQLVQAVQVAPAQRA
jgi:hypothetical protein